MYVYVYEPFRHAFNVDTHANTANPDLGVCDIAGSQDLHAWRLTVVIP